MKKVLKTIFVCFCMLALFIPAGCGNQKSNEVLMVEEALRQDALKINNSIKTFYAGIISGGVSEEKDGDRITEPLPYKSMSMADRQKAVKELTVRSALEKSGLDEYLDENVISNFVYDNEKNIYYKDDIPAENIKGTLSLNTKLGDILG